VLPTSCKQGAGVEAVFERMAPRTTAVLVGSSGVGKSTLINRLLGDEVQRTIAVRDGDSRGRHATTHRELFRLSNGALLIDSPGIRELQLWGEEASLAQAFDDISELAESCRFRDCRHEAEKGCAVLQAVEAGSLTTSRVASYHSLQKELRHLELRRNASAQRVQKHKWRAIHRELRRSGKNRRD
jgi:ribosome biogenesis GTPase